MMKLQLSVITIMFLSAMTTISSTSKDNVVVRNNNTQNDEEILALNPSQGQNKQRSQGQQDAPEKIQNQTSKYNGVCWNQDYKKWKAQLHYKGKTYYGGLFDNEEHAAMGVNLLCLKFGIKRKNLRINMNKDAIRQGSLTKRMNVKSAQKDAKYVKIVNRSNYDNSVPPNLETKDNEDIDLNTMEIRKEQDDNCDTSVELEEKEENDDDKETHFFDEEEEEDDDDESDHNYDPSANCEFVKNQISKYTGFTRKTDCKKRQVQSNHKVKNNHGRLVEIEQDAAMKVDLLCDNYKRKRKNATTKIQQDAIHRNHRPTSQYTGVQWHKDAKKWQAILSNKGKQYYGGVFDNEEHAAMKINLLCDKCGIERKNTTINIELDKIIQHAQNKTSKYTGVRWRKDNKKWEARLTNKEKWYYGGLFDIEEHAAMKVNLLCDKCEIKRKNPGIKIELDVIIQHVQNPTSKYNGVSRHKATKKWEAKFTHNQKIYYGGLFDKEEDAAMEVNLLCDKCKIERRNTMINIGQDLIQQVQNQTSKYIGIVWKEDKKKWQVELTHNKMICTGNCFDNEKRAAMAANLLCDFLCIERKNPMINIDLNEKTPQKTKSQNKKYCE